MTDHPITPPPELVQQWESAFRRIKSSNQSYVEYMLDQAARWGADQELLACGEYLERCAAWEEEDVTEMYNYRRPKPPSLKEQAQAALGRFFSNSHTQASQMTQDFEIIRHAVEQLDD